MKGIRCKPGRGATLSKVKNLGFDNIVEDCKAGCSLRDGCEAFNFGSDARCMNLRDIDFDKCEKNKAFDLYRHGRYHKLFSRQRKRVINRCYNLNYYYFHITTSK